MAAVLVLGAKVPFTRGGQDVLMHSLLRAIRDRGHLVDSIELPFSLPTREHLIDQMALWRGIALETFAGQKVDMVIGTKFPSYIAQHPRKALWLVHQHRPVFELLATNYSDFSDDPRDEALRRLVIDAEAAAIGECNVVAGISKNVITRLHHFLGIQGRCLYPPLPHGARYRSNSSENYILSVGRICGIKRIDLLIKALPMVHEFVKLKIVGQPDEPAIMEYLQNEIAKHHLGHRVEFLGRVSDEELLELYSRAMMVYYAPFDEDYGYVTLEALASGRPVVTAVDSGGVLEFVTHEETGVVVEPTLDAIARGCNFLIENESKRAIMGQEALALIAALGVSEGNWDQIVDTLLAPLAADSGGARVQACP